LLGVYEGGKIVERHVKNNLEKPLGDLSKQKK